MGTRKIALPLHRVSSQMNMPSKKTCALAGLITWRAQWGSTYLRQARNFTIGNKLPSEDCLANSHWLFSPLHPKGCRAFKLARFSKFKTPLGRGIEFGGPSGVRTHDTLLKRQVL